MELNSSQLRAISHGSGPCLVLAGPGSGKTTVMIRRIHNLITSLNVRPEHILAVTFSRSAANEMAERFYAINSSDFSTGSDSDICQINFGTLHSIFLKILNAESPDRSTLITEKQRYAFIRSEIEKYALPYESADELCRELLLEIGRVKSGQPDNRLRSDLQPQKAHGTTSVNSFPGIFTDYALHLKRSGLIDFDDIVMKCRRLLMQRPDVLARWQDRYRYILVDEFQDVSPAQYETLKLLAGPPANIFAVGDDDQSIYGFRGAGSDVMQQFMSDYPSAVRILLDKNYRCASDIQEASLKVISENTGRFAKSMLPVREGGVLTFKEFAGKKEEYDAIIENILKFSAESENAVTRNKAPSVAVLFRNNDDSSLFVRMLEDAGIPFVLKGRQTSLTDHFAIRDILTYLKIGTALKDHSPAPCRKEMLRIMNRPARYIHRDSLAAGASALLCLHSMESIYRDNPRMRPVIAAFRNDLLTIADLPPQTAITYIRRAVGYDKWLREYCDEKNLQADSCLQVLDVFSEFAAGFSRVRDLITALGSDTSDKPDIHDCETIKFSAMHASGSDRSAFPLVRVLTMHASKGMEFDIVFLPDSNDSIIPNKQAVSAGQDQIEEERRLFYVAMTRARDELHISWVRRLHNRPAEPTRFIRCLISD